MMSDVNEWLLEQAVTLENADVLLGPTIYIFFFLHLIIFFKLKYS